MYEKKLKALMKLNYPITYTKEPDYYYVWHEDLPGCRAHGDTLEEAEALLKEVKYGWFEIALELGKRIPKPGELSRYSGKLLLRLPLDLHRKIAIAAKENKVSINTYAVSLLSEALSLQKPLIGSSVLASNWNRFDRDSHFIKISFDPSNDEYQKKAAA